MSKKSKKHTVPTPAPAPKTTEQERKVVAVLMLINKLAAIEAELDETFDNIKTSLGDIDAYDVMSLEDTVTENLLPVYDALFDALRNLYREA